MHRPLFLHNLHKLTSFSNLGGKKEKGALILENVLKEENKTNSCLCAADMKRTWASARSDLSRSEESPSGQRWSLGQPWCGRRLHCFNIKTPRSYMCSPVCIVSRASSSLKHEDVFLRKTSSSQSLLKLISGWKKVKTSAGLYGSQTFSTYS